jgi:2,3-bisphosphoglycerate-dependent phosphoglycerate mutase
VADTTGAARPRRAAGRRRSRVSQRLVLMRHGQSEWNARNVFTGRADPDLTVTGEQEATHAGQLLAAHGLLPGLAHTSLQRRAIRSTDFALAACDRGGIPVRRSWRLNGRDYGALQGRDKDEVIREYGQEQVQLWRRSYAVAPPDGESLRDVTARLLPYWYDSIVPDLRTGECVLVVSHGNTLRALIKHLDRISDEEIAALEVPNGVPILYDLDPDTRRPLTKGGRRLAR